MGHFRPSLAATDSRHLIAMQGDWYAELFKVFEGVVVHAMAAECRVSMLRFPKLAYVLWLRLEHDRSK